MARIKAGDELATMAKSAEELEALMRMRISQGNRPPRVPLWGGGAARDMLTFTLAIIGAVAIGVFAIYPLARVSWTFWMGGA